MSAGDVSWRKRREPLLSVPHRLRPLYSTLFTGMNVIQVAYRIVDESLCRWDCSSNGVFGRIYDDITQIGLTSFFGTIAFAEVIDLVLGLGEFIEEKFTEPLRERRRAEGREEGRAEILNRLDEKTRNRILREIMDEEEKEDRK